MKVTYEFKVAASLLEGRTWPPRQHFHWCTGANSTRCASCRHQWYHVD